VPLAFFAGVPAEVPGREVPFDDGGAAAVLAAEVAPVAAFVEPVEPVEPAEPVAAADREAAVDVAGGAVLAPAVVAVAALATGAAVVLRAGAAVPSFRTGAAVRVRVVTEAPPAASSPGTVSAFGKPAT
jgi:hypothetical protein